MHFIIFCTDKPNCLSIRIANRPAHVKYLENHIENVLVAGPTLGHKTGEMNGSMLIVDFPGLSEAQTFAEDDPYAVAGLFESVVVKPWKMVIEPQNK